MKIHGDGLDWTSKLPTDPFGNGKPILDMAGPRITDERGWTLRTPSRRCRNDRGHSLVSKDGGFINVLIDLLSETLMTLFDLLVNHPTIGGVVGRERVGDVPFCQNRIITNSRDSSFCHVPYQQARWIESQQLHAMRSGKIDERGIIIIVPSPVVVPLGFGDKLLFGHRFALDVPIKSSLTVPAEHFHPQNWSPVRVEKDLQDVKRGGNVRRGIMRFTKIDNVNGLKN